MIGIDTNLVDKLNNSIKIDSALVDGVMHFHLCQKGFDITKDQVSALDFSVYKNKEGYTIFCNGDLWAEDMHNSPIAYSFDSWSQKINLETGEQL